MKKMQSQELDLEGLLVNTTVAGASSQQPTATSSLEFTFLNLCVFHSTTGTKATS